jgi:ABC-type lipoprotein export system ATPase subunit
MQYIYPTDSKSTTKEQTSVTIELPEAGNIIIKRSKPPDTIQVNIPGHGIIESGAAQSYIEQVFGPRDLFVTSSYIRQNSRCPLIMGSNSEKTQLLHQLTFGSVEGEAENPETYLNIIDVEYQGISKATDNEIGKYNGYEQVHSSNMSNYLKDHHYWESRGNEGLIPKLDHLEYLARVKSNTQKLQEINNKIVEVISIVSKKELVQSQLVKISIKEPTPLVDGCKIHLESLKGMVSSAKEQDKLLFEVRSLEAELEKMGDFNITPEKLDEVRDLRVSLLHQKALYNSLGINYGPDIANETIERLRCNISDMEIENCKKGEWDNIVTIETEKYNQSVEDEFKRVTDDNESYRILYEEEMYSYTKADEDFHQKLSVYNSWLHHNNKKVEFEIYLQHVKDSQESLEVKVNALMALKIVIAEEYAWYHQEYGYGINNENIVDFAHLERTITTLKMLKSQLHCPHCDGSLVLSKGILNKGVVDIASKDKYETQISLIMEYGGKLTRVGSLTIEVQRMEAGINGITKFIPPSPHPEHDLPQVLPIKSNCMRPILKTTSPLKIVRPNFGIEPKIVDTKPYYDKIALLQELKYVHVQGDVSALDDILEKASMIPHTKTLKERLLSISSKLILQESSVSDLNSQIHSIEDKIQIHTKETAIYNANYERKSQLETELEAYIVEEKRLSHGSDITKERETLTQENLIISEILRCYASHMHLVNSYDTLEKQKGVVIKYTQYKDNILKLKQTIQKVASEAMNETVEALSVIANKILRGIFTDDIEIILKTTKELKSKKSTTKLQVNMQVFYRGCAYDSPTRLSGGEQDRISIAMTLAMAKISGSPILMLDECMSSLSEHLQELSLEMIQEYTSNKTVVHVCHRAIQGQHDSIVKILDDDN